MSNNVSGQRKIRPLDAKQREDWTAACIQALAWVPAFRDAVAIMTPYYDGTAETAYTDKYSRVGLGDWFFTSTLNTQATTVLHECMHILNSHFDRAAAASIPPHAGNISGDLEINTGLQKQKGAVLTGMLLPKSYGLEDFLSMENYYHLLKEKGVEFGNCPRCEEDRKKAADQAAEQADENAKKQAEEDNCPACVKEKEEKAKADAARDADESGEGDSQDGADGQESPDSQGNQGGNTPDQGNSGDGGSPSEAPGNQQGDQGGNGEGASDGAAGGQDQQGDDGQPGSSDQHTDNCPNNPDNKGNSQGQGQGNGSGEGQGNGEGSGEGQGNGEGSGEGQGNGEGSGDSGNGSESGGDGGRPHAEGCSSNPDNQAGTACDNPTEERSNAADEAGISRSSTAEQTIARNNTRVRIQEDIKNAKSRGHGAGTDFLDYMAKVMTPPKVPWTTIFRKTIGRSLAAAVAGKDDYTYRRSNRRMIAVQRSLGKRVIFPGTVAYSPKVVVALDTSGSMGSDDYDNAMIELEGILREMAKARDTLRFFAVDYETNDIQKVTRLADVKLQGGGGTDMSKAVHYVNEMKPADRPDIFILATDGGTDWDSYYRRLTESNGAWSHVLLVTHKSGFESVPEKILNMRGVTVIDISPDD